MRTTCHTLAIVAVLAAAGFASAAMGQEIVTVSAEDVTAVAATTTENAQLSDLQSRLDALEAQLNQSVTNGYEGHAAGGGHHGRGGYGCGHRAEPCSGCCTQCDPCCGDCCPSKCRRGGPYVEVEGLYLTPFNSEGTGFVVGGATIPVDPEFEITGRGAAGWQLADGFGVRARYWEFDHPEHNAVAIAAGAFAGFAGTAFDDWDTWVADLEAFDSTDFGGWSITWSAGFRYVEYVENRGIAGAIAAAPTLFHVTKRFDGIGLTNGIEFRRSVLGNAGAFAKLRGSVLVGDEVDTLQTIGVGGILNIADGTTATEQVNTIKFIYEAQAGVEYVQHVFAGAYLFARGGAEVQYWDNFGASTLTGGLIDASSGFAGFFASAGVSR